MRIIITLTLVEFGVLVAKMGSGDIIVGKMHFMNKYEYTNTEQLVCRTLFPFHNLLYN